MNAMEVYNEGVQHSHEAGIAAVVAAARSEALAESSGANVPALQSENAGLVAALNVANAQINDLLSQITVLKGEAAVAQAAQAA